MAFWNKLSPFSHLSKDDQERKNLNLMGSRMILLSAHYGLPGAVATNYDHYLGITPEMVAPFSIPGTILGPLCAFLVTPFIDRSKNVVRLLAITSIFSGLYLLQPLLLCLGPDSFRTPTFAIYSGMICGCLATVLGSPRGGVDGVVNSRVIHNNVRGRYISIAGMGTGIIGVLVGLYVTWVTKCFDQRTALLLSTVPSVLILLFASYLNMKVKELPDLASVEPPKRQSPFKDLGKIVNMKEFRVMMPANLMRGLGDGAAGYAFWIALKRLNLPPEYAGYVTLLGSIAPFVAYGILWLCMDRFGAVWVIPASDILLVVGLMGTVLTQNPLVFLVSFLLRAVMGSVEASAIPLAHYEVVPNEVMGAFTSLRLLLLSLTGSVSATTCALLLKVLTPTTVFAGCAVLKLAAGALYWYGLVALRKHTESKAA